MLKFCKVEKFFKKNSEKAFLSFFVYYNALLTYFPNMLYEDYSAEDFLLDESFKKWLLDPDPVTVHFWETWLAQHPEKREAVEEAKEILALIQFKNHPLVADDSEQMWKTILANRKPSHTSNALPFGKVRSLVSDNLGYMVRMAAVLLLFLLTGAGFYMLSIRQSTTQYLTQYGETREILLPDSSIVTLNANSKLEVLSNWDSQSFREVWLEGEAFFHVRKKPTADTKHRKTKDLIKFTVHTNNLDVNVLGTEFNVNERRGRTRVVLEHGQVQLNLKEVQLGAQVTMNPGEMVEVVPQESRVMKKEVDPKLYSSWTTHKLILNNTPLFEIASTLEDSFGYKVIFKDPRHAKRLVRGVLPLNDMNILLEALANSLDLKVTKDKQNIIFESQ